MTIENRMTTSRLVRLSLLGQIAGDIFSGALNEGVKMLFDGMHPYQKKVIITPVNAKLLNYRFSELSAAISMGNM